MRNRIGRITNKRVVRGGIAAKQDGGNNRTKPALLSVGRGSLFVNRAKEPPSPLVLVLRASGLLGAVGTRF